VWIEQQALSPYCGHLIGDLDRMMHDVFKEEIKIKIIKIKISTNRSIFGI